MVNVTENDLTGLLVQPGPAQTQNELETKPNDPSTVDLKEIIDDNSDMVGAKMAGNAWDSSGVPVREMVQKRGNAIVTLAAEEKERCRMRPGPWSIPG